MKTSTVHGAWHISCAHEGCSESWVITRDSSRPEVPCLPIDHPKGEYEGWYWRALRSRPHDAVRYIAYCPVHATRAFAWEKEADAWRERKLAVGRETAETVRGFFPQITAAIKRAMGIKAADAVKAWMAENARPQPPWA